jgi:hypothetical protein
MIGNNLAILPFWNTFFQKYHELREIFILGRIKNSTNSLTSPSIFLKTIVQWHRNKSSQIYLGEIRTFSKWVSPKKVSSVSLKPNSCKISSKVPQVLTKNILNYSLLKLLHRRERWIKRRSVRLSERVKPPWW